MIDWAVVRAEYVTGDPEDVSYASLAKKYGCSKSTLAHRAQAGGWVAERTRYIHDAGTDLIQRVKRRDVRDRADMVQRMDDACKKIMIKLEDALDGEKVGFQELRQAAATVREVKDVLGLGQAMAVQEETSGVIVLGEVDADG